MSALLILAVLATADAREVTFAGRQWEVKAGFGGPGPNHWSDDPASVWVDDQGLHLRLRQVGGVWYGAEVRTLTCTRRGVHRFYMDAALEDLDPNVIAAAFLYRDDDNELDVEFARWGDPAAYPAQYVVQPSAIERFPLGLSGTFTTHTIDWAAARTRFSSVHGHYAVPPGPSWVIHQRRYKGPLQPEPDGMHVHLNLWLMAGLAPTDGQEVEVVFTDLELPTRRRCP